MMKTLTNMISYSLINGYFPFLYKKKTFNRITTQTYQILSSPSVSKYVSYDSYLIVLVLIANVTVA